MGRVTDKTALTRRTRLEPAEHVVHGPREARYLISRFGVRYSLVEVGVADRFDASANSLDWTEHSTDREADNHGGNDGDERNRDRDSAGERRDALLDEIHRCADDDREGVVVAFSRFKLKTTATSSASLRRRIRHSVISMTS